MERVVLRSKVARRIFSLFVLCALLPLSILAFFSYRYVTSELRGLSDLRLHEAAKSAGMTIVERMQFLDMQLEMAAAHIQKARREIHRSLAEELHQRLGAFFKGLALRRKDGKGLLLIGEIGTAPLLERDEEHHLASGKTLVFTRDTGEGHTKIFMARLMTGNETALTAADRPSRKRKTLMEALCILASMKENGQIDSDLFDVFISDHIYLRYARKYMRPEQIDEVDPSKITEYFGCRA